MPPQFMKKSFTVPYMSRDYSANWEQVFGKKEEPPMCEWNGAKMRIRMTYRGTATHSFHVDLVEGEWPEDGDLITLCDGDTPPHSRHFGGRVAKAPDGKSASVDVYVD